MTIRAVVAKTALAATELNSRAPIVDLTKDGVKFVGLDYMLKKSASERLALARDYAAIAVTPDKALVFGTVGGIGNDDGKVSAGGAIVGSTLGFLADVVEAVPAALLSLTYLGSAAVRSLRD